ncbi:MAG: endonuclease/exonuclease/phosphatase family protein [Cyclobacteriaceae bacterium]
MKTIYSTLFLTFSIVAILSLPACQQTNTIDLKIMSYNIRHGEGVDGVLDLSRAAKIIQNEAPDLCGLQEVDNFCLRTDSIGQINYLAQHTNMVGTFGKFMDYQGGEYGLATLTALPIVSTKVLRLPDGKYEPRSSVIHEIKIADGYLIAFANVHLDWIDDEEGSRNRLLQSKALLAYLDSLDLPSIITGDFNCPPESPTMKYFDEQGFEFVKKGLDNLSFQGDSQAEIDHLIFRNSDQVQFSVRSIQLLNKPVASDHRPLVVDLNVTFSVNNYNP